MVILGIVALIAVAFVLGILVYAVVRSRSSGGSLWDEISGLGFDVFFGFVTSWIGGGIARRIIAMKVRA